MSAIQQMFLATFVAAGLDKPRFISSGAPAISISAISVPAPDAYIDGDLLILAVHSANQAITTPSGWTQVTNSPQGTGTAAASGSTQLALFYKFASGTQASVSVADTGAINFGQMFSFRKVKSDTPFNATAGSVAATAVTSHSLPAITTTGKNILVAHFAGIGLDANNTSSVYTSPSNANLSNVAVRTSRTTDAGAGGGLGLVTGEKSDAGSTGATSVSVASAAKGAFVTVGLSPTTNYDSVDRVIGTYGEIVYYGGFNPESVTADITLKTDGTNTGLTTGGWYSRQVVGIGSSYWVRATTISGGGTGTVGSWLQLNAERVWSVTAAGGGDFASWTLKFEYATDSAGTNIVATTQLYLEASTERDTITL